MPSNSFLKFYTSDWRGDPALRMCGMAARGLWVEMVCIMHEATPYGHLLVNGSPPTDTQLGVLVGAPSEQVAALLGELEAMGVFSRTRAGVIYSRKLTKMAKKAQKSRKNGLKGGNPTLCKQKDNSTWDNPPLKSEDKTQKPETRYQNGIIIKDARGEGDDPPDKFDADDDPPFRVKLLRQMDLDDSGLTGRGGTRLGTKAHMVTVDKWLALGLTKAEILGVVAEVMARRNGPPNSFEYFSPAMQELAGVKAQSPLAPIMPNGKTASGNAPIVDTVLKRYRAQKK